MDTQTWITINKYYQAVWEDFSDEKLSEIFDDDMELSYRGTEYSHGKEEVLKTYRVNFFDSCKLDSTRLFDFHIQPHLNLGRISVSYTLLQFNELCGDRFGHVNESFELTNDNKKIKKLVIVSTFMT
uniref:Uncharacterized protein n=1 Tax=Marseillevirus LCMAC201 TaxID=2506605 RepID=A0A481YWS3_9VIRU|nr:MAG: hypothetical protein LCMAC201_02510 [Marseillevirus LCMAC201]